MASGERLLKRAASAVTGKIDALRHGTSEPKEGMDDVTLARKVETELFRDEDSPRGQVDVSAVDGVIELRGQVKHPEDVKALEAKARSIPEVRDVRNLLHLPKTPSPTRADSPGPEQKRGETRRAGRFDRPSSDEQPVEGAEESPAEKAGTGRGRGPAPMAGDS